MNRIMLFLTAAVVMAAVLFVVLSRTGAETSVASEQRLWAQPKKPLATVTGGIPGTKLALMALHRSGPRIVTARLRVSADASAPVDNLSDGVDLELGEYGNDDASAIRLIDERNGRPIAPLQDDEGACMCSQSLTILPPGSLDVYAKFPAPPRGVDRVSLHVPSFPSFDGVPIEP